VSWRPFYPVCLLTFNPQLRGLGGGTNDRIGSSHILLQSTPLHPRLNVLTPLIHLPHVLLFPSFPRLQFPLQPTSCTHTPFHLCCPTVLPLICLQCCGSLPPLLCFFLSFAFACPIDCLLCLIVLPQLIRSPTLVDSSASKFVIDVETLRGDPDRIVDRQLAVLSSNPSTIPFNHTRMRKAAFWSHSRSRTHSREWMYKLQEGVSETSKSGSF
jgi:hypothetical protein